MQEENDVARARESKSTNGKDATSMEMIKPPRETIHYYDFLSYWSFHHSVERRVVRHVNADASNPLTLRCPVEQFISSC